jgi:hypothetical protein
MVNMSKKVIHLYFYIESMVHIEMDCKDLYNLAEVEFEVLI